MSAVVGSVKRTGGWFGDRLSNFWAGISAVGIKELRGRMRGRRAFVVVTIYLALLSLLAFAVYIYLKQTAVDNSGLTDRRSRNWPGGCHFRLTGPSQRAARHSRPRLATPCSARCWRSRRC